MPHLLPLIIPGGQSVQGQSLGFHAYSLRVDNVTNQWLQEQTSLAWVPPYSLGQIIRLWGTGVAQILSRAPFGQPQLAPLAGEYATAEYSDVYRNELAGTPVRQFSLVQAVTDLTLGPQPATPITGTLRLWADPSGFLHRLMSTGVDATEIDTLSPLGGVLSGFLPNPGMAAGAAAANVGALAGVLTGTLPSPGMAAGAALANLAAHAITNLQSGVFGSAISTTSASAIADGDVVTYNPNAGSDVFALSYGSFANTTFGAINTMYLGFNTASTLVPQSWHTPSANFGIPITLFGLQLAVSGAPIIIQPYWQTNAGTLSNLGSRATVVLELRR